MSKKIGLWLIFSLMRLLWRNGCGEQRVFLIHNNHGISGVSVFFGCESLNGLYAVDGKEYRWRMLQ